MDRIIALYPDTATAEQTRVHLGQNGFATDRLDVVSLTDHDRVVGHPERSFDEDLGEYFKVLFTDETEVPIIDNIVHAIEDGKAVVVVHPRGKEEIEQARQILEEHSPDTMFWRVAPEEAQGGLLGEHAAGFRL